MIYFVYIKNNLKMSNVKNAIMKENIVKMESNTYKKFLEMSDNINNFFYDMLKDYSVSILLPFLSLILQYAHIFVFPFKGVVSHLNY